MRLSKDQQDRLHKLTAGAQEFEVVSSADERDMVISRMNAQGLKVDSKFLGKKKWVVFGFEQQDNSEI